MKKFFSLMLVFAAMFAFTACDNTSDMTDEELEAALIEKGFFKGKISSPDEDNGKWLAANINADKTYAFYYSETRREVKKGDVEDVLMTGTWKVLEGVFYYTDDTDEGADVGTWYSRFKISKNGKRLTCEYDDGWKVELD
ncbi:MAG: hypothetical protein IJU35_08805 [Paludibacteraceae bacterium]|nr:hypothetical protein [Paludibacteraceae bacterium]